LLIFDNPGISGLAAMETQHRLPGTIIANDPDVEATFPSG
jgi:hypothetical protein